MQIRSAQKLAWENKVAKGFNTTDVPLEFCLFQGEIAEAFDAWRKDRDDIDGATEGLNVAADSVHFGDLAMLDLRDPRLCDTHQGSDLGLGEPGVLPQLRELIAALLGAGLPNRARQDHRNGRHPRVC